MFLDLLKTYKTIPVADSRIAGLIFLLGGLTACTGFFSSRVDDGNLKTRGNLNRVEYGVKITPAVFSDTSLVLQKSGGQSRIGKPYRVKGKWYYPKQEPDYSKVGLASWYGSAFHGRLTANGETFDMNNLTAAHPTLPLPSYARVTNLKNGASLVVRVNDRGPFARNRIIDLSRRAAQLLGYQSNGLADVKVEYIGPAPLHGQDDIYLLASFNPAREDASSALFAFGDNQPYGSDRW